MLVLLLNTDDVEAIWLFRQLKKAGLEKVRMITADELLFNQNLLVRITNGKAVCSIDLNDGYQLSNESKEVFIINRITHLPLQLLNVFTEADRNYVAQEMQAIFHCLLSSFDNILFNRSTTNGFSGNHRSKNEWMLMAKGCGFHILPFSVEEDDNNESNLKGYSLELLCYDGHIFGDHTLLDAYIKEACLELLDKSNELLIGICMVCWEQQWYCTNVKVKANLKSGGKNLVYYLIEKMQHGTIVWNSRRQAV